MTYNTRSPAVKRLMKEAQELSEPTELFYAKPLEDNLFEWHFTIRGPIDTDYDGGIYHGRILLPAEYPMKPPNILLMTPSGRFEVNRKICLSISGYHPETWRPSWSIRTALLAIIGFMPTHGIGAIGSLDYPSEERRKLAKISSDFVCPQCGSIKSVLKSLTEASVADVNEAKNLASQISFTGDKASEKNNELVEPKPVNKEQVKVQPLPQEQPNVMFQPNSMPLNNEQMPFLPTMNLQPLSFEEWFYQVKCVQKFEPQGDTETLTQPNTVNITIEPIQSILPSVESEINAQETILEVEGSQISSLSSSTNHNEPIVLTSQPEIAADELRQRHPLQPESRPVVNNRANIDLASIRHRQSVLFKCILFIVGVLGFIVAARLNSMHGEVHN